MVQKTEVRIGNYVARTAGDMPITEITEEGFHFADGDILDPKYCNPIGLTPEILEKAGFKKHMDGKPLYFFDKLRYNLHHESITILRPCDKAGESQAHDCGYPFFTDRINCQYLHQLQNLYYALTNSELPITL